MAALVLTVAANAIASSFGFSAFATAALAAGAGLLGSFIDNSLFGQTIKTTSEGPRLDEVRFQSSSEGSPIYRVAGRNRIAGNIIWTTKFREEVIKTTTTSGGGKGGGGSKQQSTTIEYKYYVSFAIGLCEGEVLEFGRLWADGQVLDLKDITFRKYYGSETQGRDPKIKAVEGDNFTPGYRGLAYVVFEELLLEDFGNRIPQINVEVFKSDPRSLAEYEDKITAVDIIPSSGEFIYGTTEVLDGSSGRTDFVGSGDSETSSTQNRHSSTGEVDWTSSIDFLERAASNIKHTALVCAWHGTDMRANLCELRPKVETLTKSTFPYSWQVSGLSRGSAERVSTFTEDGEEKIYLGGAVADKAVFEAIQDLNNRGLSVMFYPFILMDIPPGNGLTDPYDGSTDQPAFPWRGRTTLSVAPGEVGSPDKTASARTEVNSFFGTAVPANFSTWDGNTIPYTGPSEWSFRRMILHYAKLCAAAGGVGSFVIGSEMVALNQIRDNVGAHPAVDNFKTLAADVRTILGSGTTITYAADWSEWSNFRPSDGSNDVLFHLDPLWSNSNIDVIGIDNYMPLSDWRDGTVHIDAQTYETTYDDDYLQSQVAGGELYDYYYASSSARTAQTRTIIDDTNPADEDWIFRPKDLVNWWQNNHHNRLGGVRSGSSTSWVPESKPIWFTEIGCPAIDKGTNQPNVFYDPKSSESFFPYFSNGGRDDFIQRKFIQAHLDYWAIAANNPSSGVYTGRMVDADRLYLWTWDARPYPEFPARTKTWSDGDNWRLGHWLTGRLGLVLLKYFVDDYSKDFGADIDATKLRGMVKGYVINDVMSARDIIQPLMATHSFDAFESEGFIKYVHRGNSSTVVLTEDDLVDNSDDDDLQGPFKLTRGQATELPYEVMIKYILDNFDYKASSIPARRLIGASRRVSESSFNLVLDSSEAQNIADVLLIDAWVMREKGEFLLPPSLLRLDATDIIDVTANNRDFQFRLEDLGYEYFRPSRVVRTDPSTYARVPGPQITNPGEPTIVVGIAVTVFMDLPLLSGNEVEYAPWLASSSIPWPGAINIYRSADATNYTLDTDVGVPTVIGETTTDFYSGPEGRWDYGNTVDVEISSFGQLQASDRLEVLSGANSAAIYNSVANEWEIIQWQDATLVGPNTYRLSTLLRGQLGTEKAIANPLPSGARFVVLEETITQSTVPANLRNLELTWQYGPVTDAIGDPTYKTVTFIPRGIGLRPLSPDHLKGSKDFASGNTTLSWIRRTRKDGDIWDNSDVPLAEAYEQYELDIYDGVTLVRTEIINDVQEYVYTSANQTTDFGGVQTQVDFEVFQISDTFGRGVGRRRLVTFLA